jgi:hypothetical protein
MAAGGLVAYQGAEGAKVRIRSRSAGERMLLYTGLNGSLLVAWP